MTTASRMDFEALRAAFRRHDAEAMTALYADDAEIIIYGLGESTPSRPMTLTGRDAIHGLWTDVMGRRMDHEVQGEVAEGDRASCRVACRYPDGTRGVVAVGMELAGGRIRRQHEVHAWDG